MKKGIGIAIVVAVVVGLVWLIRVGKLKELFNKGEEE